MRNRDEQLEATRKRLERAIRLTRRWRDSISVPEPSEPATEERAQPVLRVVAAQGS